MSAPSFLLAKESNPALLHILLEAISNIIEHQQSHNPIFTYAIIRNHAKFQALQKFDLQRASKELEERRRPKEEKPPAPDSAKASLDVPTPTTPTGAFSVGDEEDEEDAEHQETKPLSEKARGKLPEGVVIPRRESALSLRSNSDMLSPGVDRKDFIPTEQWVIISCIMLIVGCLLAPISSSNVGNSRYKPT
jgi:hypothetical protein